MVGQNLDDDFKTSPQNIQADTMPGVTKGIIVDVRDPWQAGRVRVASYGIQGDYPKMDIEALSWTEPMHPSFGSFMPPPLCGRVWLGFEGGEKYNMMYQGGWNATPMGDGTLPWNSRIGSEIRAECWHTRDLVPESLMPCASQEGNSIWINTLYLSKKYLCSSLNLMDTSGKYFKISSVDDQSKPWTPIDMFPDGEGALYNGSFGDCKATREGFEQTDILPVTTGAVEFGHQTIKRSMLQFKSKTSVDEITQQDDNQEIILDEHLIGGKVKQTRVSPGSNGGGDAQINVQNLTTSAMFLSGMFMAAGGALAPPRVW